MAIKLTKKTKQTSDTILWEIGTKLLARGKDQIFLFHRSEDVGGTSIRNCSLLKVLSVQGAGP